MKRILFICLALVFGIALYGCGSNPTKTEGSVSGNTSPVSGDQLVERHKLEVDSRLLTECDALQKVAASQPIAPAQLQKPVQGNAEVWSECAKKHHQLLKVVKEYIDSQQ